MQRDPQGTAGVEDVLDPERVICDAHHHLWDLPEQHYLGDEYLNDVMTGHKVTHSVFVEWRSHYRTGGPEALRPVGETEFAAAIAQVTKSSPTHVCAAIVGYADMTLGARVEEVLDAHLVTGKGYFRGIRHVGSWDADPAVHGGTAFARPALYREAVFRKGLRVLQTLGLSFDAWVYQTQLDDLIDLLEQFPNLAIVLNHVGGVLGTGPYTGRRDELYARWHEKMKILAGFPNLHLKLGGLGMKRSGFPFHGHAQDVGSQALADAWRPWIETAIEMFGVERCMFESNFPVDGASARYRVLWNAFKRIAAPLTEADKNALFHETAFRFYRI